MRAWVTLRLPEIVRLPKRPTEPTPPSVSKKCCPENTCPDSGSGVGGEDVVL